MGVKDGSSEESGKKWRVEASTSISLENYELALDINVMST